MRVMIKPSPITVELDRGEAEILLRILSDISAFGAGEVPQFINGLRDQLGALSIKPADFILAPKPSVTYRAGPM